MLTERPLYTSNSKQFHRIDLGHDVKTYYRAIPGPHGPLLLEGEHKCSCGWTWPFNYVDVVPKGETK